MKIKKLANFFLSLDPEGTHSHELWLTIFANRYGATPGVINQLFSLLEKKEFPELEDYSERLDDIRYGAFYALHVWYRHSKEYKKLSEVIKTYGKDFETHTSFNHLDILYQFETKSFFRMDDMIQNAYEDAEKFPENAGYLHLFADVFATVYESIDLADPDKFSDMWLQNAYDAVNRGIELNPEIAKYYCTKARIENIRQNYAEATALIDVALSLENRTRKDYCLRINYYYYYKTMVSMDAKLHHLKEIIAPIYSIPADPTGKSARIDYRMDVQPCDGEEPFVFVSYAHKDAENVIDIIAQLQDKGVRVWFDRGLPSFENYFEQLAKRIKTCSLFLFMVSPDSVRQEFVLKEVYFACESEQKEPLQVHLNDTTFSDGWKLLLKQWNQFVPYHKFPQKESINRIVEGIKRTDNSVFIKS